MSDPPVATDMMEDACKAAGLRWASFPMLGCVAEPREVAEAEVFAASTTTGKRA
jgi:transcriptional regulator of aromatic amino acid metabolism